MAADVQLCPSAATLDWGPYRGLLIWGVKKAPSHAVERCHYPQYKAARARV